MEHLHTTLRYNIKISNIRKSSKNHILLDVADVIPMAMDNADHSMGSKTRVCYECASRPPLNMSASYHVTYKLLLKLFICIDDDNKIFRTVA